MPCLCQLESDTSDGALTAVLKQGHFFQYTSCHRCPGLCAITLLQHTVCEAAPQNQTGKPAQIPVAAAGTVGVQCFTEPECRHNKVCKSSGDSQHNEFINPVRVALLHTWAKLDTLTGVAELSSFCWMTNSQKKRHCSGGALGLEGPVAEWGWSLGGSGVKGQLWRGWLLFVVTEGGIYVTFVCVL